MVLDQIESAWKAVRVQLGKLTTARVPFEVGSMDGLQHRIFGRDGPAFPR
jgi:hypothetical protein